MYSSLQKVNKLVLASILLNFIFVTSAVGVEKDQFNCDAPTDYLKSLNKAKGVQAEERDYSCLIRYSAVSNTLDEYQVINTSNEKMVEVDGVHGAWRMTMTELLNKPALASRKILLVSDGFSRVAASKDCATLRKKGFLKTKILLDAYSYSSTQNRGGASFRINEVSADKVLFEYFNGSINILSTSEGVTAQLSALGIKNVKTMVGNYEGHILDVVLKETGGGFNPVVVVGGNYSISISQIIPNVYQLFYGVEKIEFYLRAKAGSVAQVDSKSGSYICGKR